MHPDHPPAGAEVDAIVSHFEQQLRNAAAPRISEFLSRNNEQLHGRLLEELVAVEVQFRRKEGESVTEAEYLTAFTAFDEHIRRGFALADARSTNRDNRFVETHSLRGNDPDETSDFQYSMAVEPLSAATLPAVPGYTSEAFIARGGMGYVVRARNDWYVEYDSEPLATDPRDREAAQAVLALGGQVLVRHKSNWIRSEDELPEHYNVTYVRLPPNVDLPAGLIPNLTKLFHLHTIAAIGARLSCVDWQEVAQHGSRLNLHLGNTELDDDDDVESISQSSRLNSLDLRGTKVSSDCLANLAGHSLTNFEIDGDDLTEAGTDILMQMPTLDRLVIRNPTEEALKQAARIPSITRLNLAEFQGNELPTWPRSLRELSFGSAQPLRADWLEAFRDSRPYRLSVNNAPLDDSSWEALESATNVRHVILRNMEIDPERLERLRATRPELIIQVVPKPGI